MSRLSCGAIFICMLGLSSCGFTGDADGFGDRTLLMNNMAEPAQLDPAMQTSVEDQRLTLALFEGLTSYHPKTLQPVEGIAHKWTVSSDGCQYTFSLRPSLWSDGERLTATDFLYSFQRVLTPPDGKDRTFGIAQEFFIASPYAEMLFCLEGAENYHAGRSLDFNTVGIKLVDELTLQLTLVAPLPWFLELLCFPTFQPVPRHVVEVHRKEWTRPGRMVGNGPFQLKERRIGDHVRVTRNTHYHAAADVFLNSIVYFSTDQIDTALDQFLCGETHWVRGFNPKKIRGWRADPELSGALVSAPYLGTYFYRFNVKQKPLDDVRVRKALALAVDREKLVKYVLGLGEEPASGIVAPCLEGSHDWIPPGPRGQVFDPERARALLAEAGYGNGRGFPHLVLSYNTDIKNKAVAEVVQQMWKDTLGISIELLNREKRVHMSEERAGNYAISRGSWIGDFSDPYTFLEFMRGSGSNNRTGWSNPKFNKLLESSLFETSPRKRLAMLAEAETILSGDDVPLLLLFHYRSANVIQPGLFEGIHPTGRDLHPPRYIRRKQ